MSARIRFSNGPASGSGSVFSGKNILVDELNNPNIIPVPGLLPTATVIPQSETGVGLDIASIDVSVPGEFSINVYGAPGTISFIASN